MKDFIKNNPELSYFFPGLIAGVFLSAVVAVKAQEVVDLPTIEQVQVSEPITIENKTLNYINDNIIKEKVSKYMASTTLEINDLQKIYFDEKNKDEIVEILKSIDSKLLLILRK